MSRKSNLRHWCALLGMLVVPGLAFANADVAKLTKDPKNWAMQAGDFSNHRYTELKQITKDNVKNLSVAWTFSTGVLRGHEGGPLVIGETMFVHSPFPNKVFAISLEDQKILWKYEPKQDPTVIPVMCCDTVNRGLAYADGKVFLQQADTTLVALDSKTGKVVWSVKKSAKPIPTHRTSLKTKSLPEFPVVNSVCRASWLRTTSTLVSKYGKLTV
jgi:lanthanide-dependent methanol dehydrogenase